MYMAVEKYGCLITNKYISTALTIREGVPGPKKPLTVVNIIKMRIMRIIMSTAGNTIIKTGGMSAKIMNPASRIRTNIPFWLPLLRSKNMIICLLGDAYVASFLSFPFWQQHLLPFLYAHLD